MPPRKHTNEYLETQVVLLKEELDSQIKLLEETKIAFKDALQTVMRPQLNQNIPLRSENLQLRAKIARLTFDREDMASKLYELTGDKKWLKYTKSNP